MAYSTSLNMVVGDTLPELVVTLKDKNTAATGKVLDADDSSTWAPINLTGATVRLRLREIGKTTITDTRTMTITGATNGECSTNFTASSFPTAGTYEGEIEMTFSTGGIQTVFELVKFKVRDDFD
tara:strand:+ start:201 stop:575 length:375 start_codon:yes stop_codon:yes gene_type:complete